MADHSLPSLASAYADVINIVNAKFADLAKALDPASVTATNLPDKAIRWSSANGYFEIYTLSTTSWARLQSATAARAAIGLDSVNNTADSSKPVSTAQAASIATKVSKAGDAMTGAFDEAVLVSMASSSTMAIGSAGSNNITVTGTNAITSFGTYAAGAKRTLTFSSALTLTHNATSLILPGNANITTAAGDVAVMQSLGSGNWRCIGYTRANGTPVVGATIVSASESVQGIIEIAASAEVAGLTDPARAVVPAYLKAGVAAALNASGSAPMFASRAWGNFNGTGTVAIRGSGNVSSLTDVGVGNYTVNLTTSMPDANYAVTTSYAYTTTTIASAGNAGNLSANNLATGTFSIFQVDGPLTDSQNCFFSVFR